MAANSFDGPCEGRCPTADGAISQGRVDQYDPEGADQIATYIQSGRLEEEHL
jgi:hypothetical protein